MNSAGNMAFMSLNGNDEPHVNPVVPPGFPYFNGIPGPYSQNLDIPYQIAQYVESTGNQYIDTGIMQAGDLEIGSILMPAKSAYDSSMGWGYFVYFGCGYKDRSDYNIICRTNYIAMSSMIFWFANPGSPIAPVSMSVNTDSWNTVTVDASKAVVNGITHTYSSTPIVSNLKNDLSIYIFAGNKPDENPWRPMLCKMHHFWIKKNGVLIQNLIPVSINNSGYMYDMVSNTLKEPIGTEQLKVGPII